MNRETVQIMRLRQTTGEKCYWVVKVTFMYHISNQ